MLSSSRRVLANSLQSVKVLDSGVFESSSNIGIKPSNLTIEMRTKPNILKDGDFVLRQLSFSLTARAALIVDLLW